MCAFSDAGRVPQTQMTNIQPHSEPISSNTVSTPSSSQLKSSSSSICNNNICDATKENRINSNELDCN